MTERSSTEWVATGMAGVLGVVSLVQAVTWILTGGRHHLFAAVVFGLAAMILLASLVTLTGSSVYVISEKE